MGRQVTDQEIEEGLDTLAQLIDWYGNAYWPIFEHLEMELQKRQNRQSKIKARLRPDTDFS